MEDIEDVYDTSYEFSKNELINDIVFLLKYNREELEKQNIEYIRNLWVKAMENNS